MPMDRVEQAFVATAITGFLVMMAAIVWMMMGWWPGGLLICGSRCPMLRCFCVWRWPPGSLSRICS